MLRKIVCALFVLGLSFGMAMGDDLKGKIVKIDDKKVTFQTFDKETKKFGEAKDYDIAKDVKVSKREKKKNKVEVADGLKAEAFTKISDKGLFAQITTSSDGKVTEIVLGGGKKKKTNQ
jgi:hypothetical protein